MNGVRFLTLVSALVLAGPLFGQTAGMLSFQGLIKDGQGQPITGTVDLEFRIFDAETLGNLVDMDGDGLPENICGEDAKCVSGVTVIDGVLSTKFGPVHPAAFDGTERWLELSVDGSPLSRIEMATAPATSEQVNRPTSGTPAMEVGADGDVIFGRGSSVMSIERTLVLGGARGISADPYARIQFQNFDHNEASPTDYIGAEIRSHNDGSSNGGDLRFRTNAGAGATTERMRITKDGDVTIRQNLTIKKSLIVDTDTLVVNHTTGNVAIGHTDPSAKLDVKGTTKLNGDVEIGRGNGVTGIERFLVLAGARGLSTNPYARIQFQNFDNSDGDDGVDYIGAEILSHNAGSSDGGDLRFRTNDGSGATKPRMRITKNGDVGIGTDTPAALLHLKNDDSGGSFKITDSSSTPVVRFRIDSNYHLAMKNDLGVEVVRIADDGDSYFNGGNVGIGTNSPDPWAKLDVVGNTRTQVLRITGGSDIAEAFNVHSSGPIESGMVVAIDADHPGELRVANRAYDPTVAGIISGAGGVNAGMTLQQEGTAADGSHPVALTGRVYCWCDAGAGGPIKPGDMLTTSDTPGHAMKVLDRNRATGAIVGKALSSLKDGVGLVLVLVTLQ